MSAVNTVYHNTEISSSVDKPLDHSDKETAGELAAIILKDLGSSIQKHQGTVFLKPYTKNSPYQYHYTMAAFKSPRPEHDCQPCLKIRVDFGKVLHKRLQAEFKNELEFFEQRSDNNHKREFYLPSRTDLHTFNQMLHKLALLTINVLNEEIEKIPLSSENELMFRAKWVRRAWWQHGHNRIEIKAWQRNTNPKQ